MVVVRTILESDVYVSGYGWSNSLRHAWAVSTNHPQYWDYFREPLWVTRRCIGFVYKTLDRLVNCICFSCTGYFVLCRSHDAILCRASTKEINIRCNWFDCNGLSLPYTSLWSNGYPLSTLGFGCFDEYIYMLCTKSIVV